MIYLIISLLVLLVSLVVLHFTDDLESIFFVSNLTALLSGATAFILLITIPINRESDHERIASIKQMQLSIDEQRKNANELEGATFRIKIVETNEWIASEKYANHSYFDYWIPDEIDSLEYVK